MGRTALTVTSLSLNTLSTSVKANPDATNGNFFSVSDASKLFIRMYNGDTGVFTFSVTAAGSTASDWVATGSTSNLSTSIASSAVTCFGGFEGVKYKNNIPSTERGIWITTTSTCSTLVSIEAYLVP
jgi:hypothetical protein